MYHKIIVIFKDPTKYTRCPKKTTVSEVIRFSLTCNRFFSGTPFTYLHIKYYISCSKNPMMVTHKDWLEFSKVRNLKSKVMRRIFINVHLRISSALDCLKKMNTNSALEAFSFHAICIFCYQTGINIGLNLMHHATFSHQRLI